MNLALLYRYLAGQITGHPVLFACVLFVLSSAVSIYSNELKRFLREWPKSTVDGAARRIAANRLGLLRGLHNDSYALLRYVLWEVTDVFYQLMLLFALLFFLAWLFTGQSPSRLIVSSILPGVLAGKIVTMRQLLRELFDYDKSIKALETQLGTTSDERPRA